jgi:dolichol-phosphate mannosyltransferase
LNSRCGFRGARFKTATRGWPPARSFHFVIELSIILPTFNERGNVKKLLENIERAMGTTLYEVIFVDDDSRDGTADLVRSIAQRDPKVRIVHRVNRRGLSSACIEGMMSSAAPYVAVMDADLQHDERILPQMMRQLIEKNLDIVVGSRNVEGGSMGEFAKTRVALSMLGRRLSEAICRCEIHDPMSGFFLLRRSFLLDVVHRTSGLGFKILVDLLSSSPRPVKLGEVPYTFRARQHGESKLDITVGVEYLQLLVDKVIGDFIPSSFVLFSLVGGIGVLVHLSVLWLLLAAFSRTFLAAQTISTIIAMTVNFLLNNLITYRDRKLKGWGIVRGLVSFYLACSIGVFINLKLADSAVASGTPWYVAGLFGLAIGSIWNYGVTRLFTWRSVRRVTYERAAARLAASNEQQKSTAA